jgi:hypothetical protein
MDGRTMGRGFVCILEGNQSSLQGNTMKTLATDRALVASWLQALAGLPLPPSVPAVPAVTPSPGPAPTPSH